MAEDTTKEQNSTLVGSYVRVHGLQARPELNGTIGRCYSWDAEAGRAGIKILTDDGGKKNMLALKPMNLAIVADDEATSLLRSRPAKPSPGADKWKHATSAEVGTALYRATKFNETELVAQIISANPSGLEYRDDEHGATSLYAAAFNGKAAVARVLLEAGADKEATSAKGFTPLFRAAIDGKAAVVEVLLEFGAHFETKNDNGVTPLYSASHFGHAAVVKLLLAAAANTEAVAATGMTPLAVAASRGNATVVQLLLDAGANANAKDRTGSLPVELARTNGEREQMRTGEPSSNHSAVVQMLRSGSRSRHAPTDVS